MSAGVSQSAALSFPGKCANLVPLRVARYGRAAPGESCLPGGRDKHQKIAWRAEAIRNRPSREVRCPLCSLRFAGRVRRLLAKERNGELGVLRRARLSAA